MSMEPFHFLRPEWLLALIPLTLALWLMYRRKGQAGNWRSVCDPALLPYLMIEEKAKKASRALPLIGLAGLLAILALSGPSWRQMEQPLFRGEGSLVILLDLSRSMEATDIKPSRVARARYELLDILRKRREGQTALIVYAAQPFVVSPLTDDTRTIASLVNSLTTDIMPSQGSRPDLALGKGIELLKQAGSASGDLLFISDGLSNEALTRTLAARPQGYPVSVLAMGTSQGAPIPLAGGGFMKNPEGDIVISRLRETQLRRLATESGGRFSYLSADDRDIDSLLSQFDVEKSDEFDEKSAPLSSLWRDEGPWLVLLLLPLAALAFRRGYLLLVVFLILPLPPPAHAFDWDSLWSRPDQRAARTLESGTPAEAADQFQNREWKAAAHYRAGAYEEALKALEGSTEQNGDYNSGNALARLGRLPEAIEAYDRALKLSPENEDARYNRELVKKLLKKEKQEGQEEQERQEEQEGQEGQEEQEEQEGQEDPPAAQLETDDAPESGDPEDEATQQWLRRIPDDPGGLLRRKFQYQYQQQYQGRSEEQPW